jgi:hypothetical protein
MRAQRGAGKEVNGPRFGHGRVSRRATNQQNNAKKLK